MAPVATRLEQKKRKMVQVMVKERNRIEVYITVNPRKKIRRDEIHKNRSI